MKCLSSSYILSNINWQQSITPKKEVLRVLDFKEPNIEIAEDFRR